MSDEPGFDVAAAHRFFAADCFNRAWTMMDKPLRSAQEERLLVALNQASIFHWMQRPDCEDRNLSIGYWQASRIQVLLDRPDEAVRQAEICLGYSADLPPFYRGYAHEAMARAEALANRLMQSAQHKQLALELAQAVEAPDERQALLDDLATI